MTIKKNISSEELSPGSLIGPSSEEHQLRLQKVRHMQAQHINPWPAHKPITATCAQIIADFENQAGQHYQVAGRLMTIREHGKSIFAHIQDRTGQLQIYLKKDEIGEKEFDFFCKQIDSGDIVWCNGFSFKTKLGEISLHVTEFSLLSKSLHPLPDKFHGLADVEVKYRQRYLDLIMSHESRQRFLARSYIIRTVRDTLDAHDFIEVETPMLHPIPGGAAAKPFVTHHNALDMELFLRIAPELYLKKLVIGGFERVYEINRCFRNEGISTRHNPEFTSVEYYMAYQDYYAMMNLTEEIIKKAVQGVNNQYTITYNNYTLDFEKPFVRISMIDAVAQVIGCSVEELGENTISTFIQRYNIKLDQDKNSWGYALYALFEKLVEHTLIQPTFITQFPVEVSPLSKRNEHNPSLVDRFELFIAAMELSNGFAELNDPFDQADRFAQQAQVRAGGDEEAHYYDADFITALEYGLPPTVGAGIGIDRLVMLITHTPSIRDVILFPTLKRKDGQ